MAHCRAKINELPGLFEDFPGGPVGGVAPQRAFPHGHEFDEAHIQPAFGGKAQKVRQFVIVHAAHGHGVELERRVMLLKGVQGVHDARQEVATGYGSEAFGPQAVQRKVDAHSQFLEQGSVGREHDPVGGEAQVYVRMCGAQAGQKFGKALAYKGFAPGKPNLVHPHGREQVNHFLHFFITHDMVMRDKSVVHPAVTAAQIAAVGHGKAQIMDFASERIPQGGILLVFLGDHGTVLSSSAAAGGELSSIRGGARGGSRIIWGLLASSRALPLLYSRNLTVS